MAKRHRPRREDYTVGWVCALPNELAAAQEMLDDEHEDLDQDENDTNLYSLGRIGDHNVVIVCLPAGLIGNNPAAAVATQMKATFRSLRFGLMVGIGGGVPRTEVDIRLGDVVVSQPHQGYGGVIQYDFGKTTPSGFERTGFLNSPPLILLNAVAKMRANHLRRRSNLSNYISKLGHLPEFTRDKTGADVLFEAMYNHTGGHSCESCGQDKLVKRQPRESGEVVVHYGTIASGNQVMRDGATRDRVSMDFGGVLCFEMEAAGLMNSFPCLVIRGICDYADSHKNKTWQSYAAGTAAACAKEVLSMIPMAEVAESRTVDELIRESSALESLLTRLPFAVEAPFNSCRKQHEPTCLHNTRVDVLWHIFSWADGRDERCIFWLNGLAGTGKSTIARTIAHKYSKQERLGASFFFSRGGGDVSHAGKFITSIAVQLADNVPALRHHICEAISRRERIASESFSDQWRQLVLDPLSKLNGNSGRSSYILVVDALDECDDDNNIRIILQLLSEARLLTTVQLRVFLTSRPEIPIRHGFYHIPGAEHQDFVLHNVSSSIVDHDISIFLEYSLGFIQRERGLDIGWPGEKVIGSLAQKASGLFIWAATACRFIQEGGRQATKRLDKILQDTPSVTAPEKQLNEIYTTVLQNSISDSFDEEEKQDSYGTLREILGGAALLLSPLARKALANLLHIPQEDVKQTLEDLHAILDIPEDQARPIRLHHPSFRDFLIDKKRCNDPNLWVDEKQTHRDLADRCIRLMSTLERDVCGLERDPRDVRAPGILTNDIDSSRVEQYLSPEVQYACLYWVQHFQRGDTQLRDNSQVYKFLKERFLYWFEALGWMRKISEGILAIASLESMIIAEENPHLFAFIHDAKRFALYNRSAIEQTPFQIYYSALIFAPEMSIIREQFGDQMPRWVQRLSKVQNHWGGALQTLEGHSGSTNAVAFSPDGKQLASGSGDRTVRLWDPATGAALQTLEGHLSYANAVTFSPDGKQLASGSYDSTIKLWNPVTGAALQTLEGHSSPVNAVTFSPDGKQLASASGDSTIKLWNPVTGTALQTLEGHWGYVNAVTFSPDGKQLASASDDSTIKLWNPVTGTALQTLEGHSSSINAVAFSPDGKQLASASGDSTIKLWNPVTGTALQTLEGHSRSVRAVTFSPDGKQLASASNDSTIKLWNPVTGAKLQTLEGHLDYVNAVTFSPDGKQLASASDDSDIKLWNPVTGATLQTLEGHLSYVNAVTFSPDGKQLASGSYDSTIKLWNPVTGAALQTLEGHSSPVNAVTFSPDGKQLASASNDCTVKLWNPVTGETAFQTLEGHRDYVNAVTFSPDGKQLASASGDSTVKLWNPVTGGTALQTLEGHRGYVNAVTFSPDGKQLASAADDSNIKLWNPITGAALQTLEGHSSYVDAVTFSPDGKQLASASGDCTIKRWDSVTGAALQTLVFDVKVTKLSFSRDGSYLDTDRGVIDAASLFPTVVPPQPAILRGIFVKEQWIAYGMQNILWLPPEFRETCVAVRGNTVALGHRSGRVSIFHFEM